MIKISLSERLLRRLHNIALNDTNGSPEAADRSVYVLQIDGTTEKAKYVFYVGETAHDVSHRIRQHRAKGALSARMFRNGTHEITADRKDLYEGLPKFRTQRAARKAEGLIADFLIRRGFRAYSDQATESE